ncbi:MAG: LLM class flavin-dependent oxidoreductase [Burkholderiaceae bacterium]
MPPFSLLDLSPIPQGADAARALRNTTDLAQHAEGWGYRRVWLAEHHNMPGIASAATAVVLAHVAAHTSTIRIGSGGVMLPNHAPLVIAEQFGTLAALHPGRIDLGLGRAPGTDPRTAAALRRHLDPSGDSFPQDVQELLGYFRPAAPGQAVRAVPGAGLDVPVWLLGSSLFSAQLAAELGLPFAFASHFAPGYLEPALMLYRQRFRPSARLERPHAMVAVNVFAADDEAAARRMFTSLQQQFVNLVRGTPGPLPAPVDDMEAIWSPAERAHIERSLAMSAVGTPDTVRSFLEGIAERTGADELMLAGQIHDHAARLRSFEIAASMAGRGGRPSPEEPITAR